MRKNFYKDILKHSYPSLFVDGFEIKSLDTELEGLTPEDKAEIIEYVVNALELNLQNYEVGPKIKIKQKRFKTNVTINEDNDLNNVDNYNAYENKMSREYEIRHRIQKSSSIEAKPMDPDLLLPF